MNAAPQELLLNHELALRCEVGNRRGFLPATGRSNRAENQKLQSSPHTKNVVHTQATRKLLPSNSARHILLWCERGDDFFKARVAAQRVPKRQQFQLTI